MSLVLADRVRETTQTTGTGTITLDGAVQGFQSFSVIGNNNTTYYTINRGSEWEVGIGTYYGGTLSRDTVYASSNGGSKVNFSAGSKDVFVTYPASKSVNEDANNRVLIPYTSGTTNVGSLNVGDATGHTDSGVIAGFTASEPLYLYTSLQNTSSANTSYASYAVNDGGHTAYGELGINNSNYSYSAAGFPNNGFSTPLATFVESYGGPLVLGSWDSQKISFIVNGAVNTSDAMTVETTGAVTIPSVAVTGGAINNATIGATTSNTGTFTTLIGGGGSANYGQLTGGATTKAVQFQTLGSDSNVSLAIQPKGTGAIDLAAGSGGVNISNGGTVTAITGTVAGSYTTTPTFTISAPTTAGGTQATGTVTMQLLSSSTVASGGTGYTLNDVITLSGGTSTVSATVTVSAVSGGVVTAFTLTNAGVYTVLPTNPISTTGGTGTGFTITGAFGVRSAGFTITNAGSGYVEQPTVTFSSGSATAYATVGSDVTIKSIGANLLLNSVSGTQLQASDLGGASSIVWWGFTGSAGSTGTLVQRAAGGGTNTSLAFVAKGSGSVQFATNNTIANIQFQVSNTASAVNYVQVTGATTTNRPRISFEGSDTNIGALYLAKGSSGHSFCTDSNASTVQFAISRTLSATNYLQVTGGATGSAPVLSAQGSSDADVDITFTPKGAGAVRFGTYTGTILTPTGFITIKDSGGTSRRLLVG